MKKVLLFGSHPDDIEMGVGGTILQYREKYDFYYVCFTKCLDLERNKNLMDEYEKAVEFMGIKSEILDIPNRRFPEHSFEIREFMEEKKRSFDPDVVFCPASCDIHQDHKTIYLEAYRVFRNKSILGYGNIRSSMGFQPNLYVTLDEDIVKKKIELLEIYGSQSSCYYMTKEALMSPLNFYGFQIGRRYAEGFEIIRAIL